MVRRLLMVGLVTMLLHGTVAAEPYRAFEGYCVDGKPVITYWDPKLDAEYEPDCEGSKLGLRQKKIEFEGPPIEFRESPPPPDDWSAWAHIWLNNKGITNPYNDVIPYVTASTGRTMIPLRMVTEAMGGTAEWEEATQKVTVRLGDRYMEMTIGKTEAVANGRSVTIDQPPLLWMDRTMVPLRVVVEAFGAQVGWDDVIQRVDISLLGVTCAPGFCLEWLQ